MAEDNKNHPSAGGTNAPDFNKIELDVLKFWEQDRTFEKSLEKTKHGTPYIFYDGPPFATGLPHYGHILASTIKDAVPRYWTMKGRFVRRRWGWDCHGLPIENIVEQNLKISGKKQIEEIGIERFNKVCRDNVLNFAHEWGKMVKRMGRWVDFDNSYKTMDTTYMESVWWALKQVWEKNLIYEDRKVLLYCSRCETPISNFEVAMDNSYREITEESVYAKFKLLKGQRIINDLTNDRTYALAWTTTPWTLPGNTSLNVGADITYVIIEQEKDRFLLAKDRLSIVDGDYEIVAEFPGRALEGLEYEPLYPGVIPDAYHEVPGADIIGGDPKRSHRIYLADFVTTTDGTGIVHNAAMYGEEDYQLAKGKNLPRMDMLDHKGQYLPMAPQHLRGVFFKDADRIVINDLKEKNLLYKTQGYMHSYPHCYRCGTPLFYNALPAWFIDIQKIKPQLLQNNEAINWYPEHLKYGRFAKSMEQAPDWNISRNRYWATALPFWKCANKECKNVTCVGSIAELKEKSVNFDQIYPNYDLQNLDKLDLHRPYIDNVKLKCEKCNGDMTRIPEVVDCWVESASMPFAELHYPFEHNGQQSPEDFQNRFPADFVAEYIAQTRAWFYVMHVMSTMLFDQAPFKNVVTTGTILAEDGSKMSKSKGNFPDPNIVIEKYGVDALRFYLLSSPVMSADDLNFSEKGVQEVSRKVSMLLYNVWSFYRLYDKSHMSDGQQPAAVTNVLDRWMMERLKQVQKEITAQMDAYNTVRASRAIVDFINDLSTWYVRRSRDRMKLGNEESRVALSVLGYVLVEFSKLLAPFMPFLSDFIYRDLTQQPSPEATAGAAGKESVHLADWPNADQIVFDQKILDEMDVVREAVSLGLAARKEAGIAVRQPLARIAYKTAGDNQMLSEELNQLVLEELNTKRIDAELFNQKIESVRTAIGTGRVQQFYLDTHIDEDLKKEGLARELERQVQDLRKKSGLKVGDLVDVYYNTTDEQLEESLLNLFDRKKTFVNQITKSFEVEADFEIQSQVDGRAIWLGLVKI